MEITDAAVPVAKTLRERKQKYYRTENGAAKRRADRKAFRKDPAARDRKYLRKPFVAWDGEGVSREDGRHDYVLLANSEGAITTATDYLHTVDIFEFLLDNSHRNVINVIYGASYDWNCWLADLSQEEAQELYSTGRLLWNGYDIAWRRGKSFRLAQGERKILFYDVVSFFQTSFVKACDSYLGERFSDRDMIVENKMLRSSFRPDDLKEIIRYNEAELRNLVALMVELRERLFRAGLKIGRWDGPGAIAVAQMGAKGIKNHMQVSPDEVKPAVRSAYFGGRFEIVKCGHVNAETYEYDINSAYPWALLDVPSLAGGEWEHVNSDPGSQPFAIYHLRYSSATAPTFPQPLPVRYPTGNVAYPMRAEGWYWTPEADVAREYVAMYGGELTVVEAWIFRPAPTVKPFAYIADLYSKRQALKANGDGAHVGIKLALNSHYGKLAQQVGWRNTRKGPVLPPYHQLEWAGYVTAKCRAAVFRAALPVLSRVIAWETDAVFSEVPLPVEVGAGLGKWEYTEFSNFTYLQSGFYFADVDAESSVDKTRGVDRGSLTRETVLEAMNESSETVLAPLTRFITLGQALQGRWDHWRRWETVTKNLALDPGGKRVHIGCPACNEGTFTMGEWHSTIPAAWALPRMSCEYEIEWENPGSMSEHLSALRKGHYEGSQYDD